MSSSSTTAGRGVAGHQPSFKVLGTHKTRVLQSPEGSTQVVFHQTPVVTFDAHRIALNTGGWRTRSSKVRMNQASQEFGLGFRVYQKQGAWFVKCDGQVHAFAEDRLELSRTAGSQEAA